MKAGSRSPVLDSYALLAFLFRQKGHDVVTAALEEAAALGHAVLMASPNWAEVRYIVERKTGTHRWPEVRERLLGLPLEIVAADQELAELAGELKAKRRMSLADAFAAALARQRKASLYTGDPEFRTVEREIEIVWL